MNETPEAPPVMAPPVMAPPKADLPKSPFQRFWAGFVAFVLAIWKFVYPVVKLAKGGKILLTASTMLLSVLFYSRYFGWTFAAGFVVCILIHEMGHVFAAWRLGVPVSAPIFIPGMGALILGKKFGESPWEGAIIGYGGPLFGTVAGLVCWGLFGLTHNPLFLGLAFTAFLLNLFNMMPIFPMDGGRIVGAVSPYIWVVGLVGMIGLTLTGFMSNPFVWLLIILSLPNVVAGFKRKEHHRTTTKQRSIAGVAYVGLCAFLVWGMAETHMNAAAQIQEHPHNRPTLIQ